MERADAAPGDGVSMLAADRMLVRDHQRSFLRSNLRRGVKWYLDGTEAFWPLSDFAIRFFIGAWFLRSGLVKFADWETAIYLAANEYPVSWMEPTTAATIGLAIELIGPILLVAGAFTRSAAFAMAALIAVSQAVYVPTTSNLLVIAMLGWYVLAGPGALSIDRALSSSLRIRPLPFVWLIIAVSDWSREHLAPILMAAIRIWLGVSLLTFADLIEPPIWLRTWLPTTIFFGFPDWLAIVVSVFFFTGFGAVIVSYGLFALIGIYMITNAHPDVTLFPFLFLSIYEAKGAGVFSVDRAILAWLQRNILT